MTGNDFDRCDMQRRISEQPTWFAAGMVARMHNADADCWECHTEPEPTDAPPGSAEKIEVMIQRLERGEQLFHPDDERYQRAPARHDWWWLGGNTNRYTRG